MADDNDLLLKMLEQLRDELARDRDAGRQSRTQLYSRVDEVLDRLGKMETSIAISGQIDAQVREELDELKRTVEGNAKEIAPTVEQWRDIMKTGRRVSWVLGIAGLTSIGSIVAALTGAWDWLRSLFRIG